MPYSRYACAWRCFIAASSATQCVTVSDRVSRAALASASQMPCSMNAGTWRCLRRNSTHSGVKSSNTRSRRAVRTAPSISCSFAVPGLVVGALPHLAGIAEVVPVGRAQAGSSPPTTDRGRPRSGRATRAVRRWRCTDGWVSIVTSSYIVALRFFGVYHWNERSGSSPRRDLALPPPSCYLLTRRRPRRRRS